MVSVIYAERDLNAVMDYLLFLNILDVTVFEIPRLH
jgi:hypothetical protein